MKKRWRSVEASKGEAMLVLPCASPNYPQVFLAVPILEKGCDKTGEGERKTSHEFGQIQTGETRGRWVSFLFILRRPASEEVGA